MVSVINVTQDWSVEYDKDPKKLRDLFRYFFPGDELLMIDQKTGEIYIHDLGNWDVFNQ